MLAAAATYPPTISRLVLLWWFLILFAHCGHVTTPGVCTASLQGRCQFHDIEVGVGIFVLGGFWILPICWWKYIMCHHMCKCIIGTENSSLWTPNTRNQFARAPWTLGKAPMSAGNIGHSFQTSCSSVGTDDVSDAHIVFRFVCKNRRWFVIESLNDQTVIITIVEQTNIWWMFQCLDWLTDHWLPVASESFPSSRRQRLHGAATSFCSTRLVGCYWLDLSVKRNASCGGMCLCSVLFRCRKSWSGKPNTAAAGGIFTSQDEERWKNEKQWRDFFQALWSNCWSAVRG